jgi:hypothetical protein
MDVESLRSNIKPIMTHQLDTEGNLVFSLGSNEEFISEHLKEITNNILKISEKEFGREPKQLKAKFGAHPNECKIVVLKN